MVKRKNQFLSLAQLYTTEGVLLHIFLNDEGNANILRAQYAQKSCRECDDWYQDAEADVRARGADIKSANRWLIRRLETHVK